MSRNSLAWTAVLAATRLLPGKTPLVGSLKRLPILSIATGAMLAYTIVGLTRRDGGDGAGRTGPAGLSYEEWTHAELYERARALEIPGRSRMSKDELIAELRRA